MLTEDRPYPGDLLGAPGDGFDELAHRRAAAEQAAMIAEIDAAAAAARAAAAIAAAARAAEEAEVAADAATHAAEEAAAAAAEERTSAAYQAGARSGGRAHPVAARGCSQGADGDGAARSWAVVPGAAQGMGGAPPAHPLAPGAMSSWPTMFPAHPDSPGAPWDLPPDETPTIEGAAAGGRAARRRSAEAAEAETTVIPVDRAERTPADADEAEYDADYDPEYDAEYDPEYDPGYDGDAEEAPVRRLDRKHAEQPTSRFGRRPVLVVVAVGVVLIIISLLAAIVGWGMDRPPAEAPAPVPSVAPEVPGAQVPPPPPGPEPAAVEIDPTSDKAVSFVRAMRAADIATSRSGRAETQTAAMICLRLDQGASADTIARTIPAALPSVERRQAAEVVDLAAQLYC
ncbi:DUF732 domain-containing protein [Pseudonocardia xinjiangensis]|uniref:DUF732 domain-containing protein n=1 Tax=Pseudonocardia xinjiangensis TaxID=75289 RepID=UPI003D8BE5EC